MKQSTAPNWNKLIKDWQSSNLNQREFCRQNNLTPHQFVYYKKKYTDVKTAKGTIPTIRELEIKPQTGFNLEFKFDTSSNDFIFRLRF